MSIDSYIIYFQNIMWEERYCFLYLFFVTVSIRKTGCMWLCDINIWTTHARTRARAHAHWPPLFCCLRASERLPTKPSRSLRLTAECRSVQCCKHSRPGAAWSARFGEKDRDRAGSVYMCQDREIETHIERKTAVSNETELVYSCRRRSVAQCHRL